MPADSKWYRNPVVARVLVDTLEGLDMRFPESNRELDGIRVE